jgi:hypothetical protein
MEEAQQLAEKPTNHPTHAQRVEIPPRNIIDLTHDDEEDIVKMKVLIERE